MLTVTPLRRFTSETAAVTGMKCHDQSRRDKAGRGRLLTRGTHRLRIAPKLCWHKAGGSGPSRMCGCHNTRFFFKRWYSSSREKQCSVHLSTPQRKEIKDPGTHKEKDFCSFCVIYNFHTVPVRESVNRECLKGRGTFLHLSLDCSFDSNVSEGGCIQPMLESAATTSTSDFRQTLTVLQGRRSTREHRGTGVQHSLFLMICCGDDGCCLVWIKQ